MEQEEGSEGASPFSGLFRTAKNGGNGVHSRSFRQKMVSADRPEGVYITTRLGREQSSMPDGFWKSNQSICYFVDTDREWRRDDRLGR
jgi:hypothetical protein